MGAPSDDWVDAAVHRYSVKYCEQPADDQGIEWLRGCLRGGLRCLQDVLNHYGGPGYEVARVMEPCEEVLNVVKRAMESRSEEVYLRAGELVGVMRRYNQVKADNALLQKRLDECGAAERTGAAAAGEAAAFKAQVDRLTADNAALQAALAAEQARASDVAARCSAAEAELRAAQQRLAEPRIPQPPPQCLACEEYAERCERYGEEIAALRDAGAAADAARAAEVADARREAEVLRQQFGAVDAAVEEVKASVPKRCLPAAFHRCSSEDHRWLFGSRRVSIHPAGQGTSRGAVVLVGGGYLPLRDFVLKMGEAEALRERRHKPPEGKPSAPRPRRAASLQFSSISAL